MLVILMLASMTACSSHKKIKKDIYEDIYIDDVYDEQKPEDESELMKEVRSWLGAPYRYGGHSKQGTDCSGMVMEVFKAVYGKSIAHNSADIYNKHCKKIKRDQLSEGDLVFFSFVKSGKISHVGIYIGDNKFVHASSSKGVIISDLTSRYYEKGYVGSGRVR